ncbi:hypothetical protein [Gloeothece verrucosa]|uniref:NHL repeat containing protein n=1 Tax=Gloeothece verrucosa (strain PCC 7822) TaxID=497965 RepID=E0UL76_GLOV7|nr:hypothetical protein [Gloeothece verrucosa]ADN17706.1 conserved hypothetical protein [Gloeothece verrucosa PCC 7822]
MAKGLNLLTFMVVCLNVVNSSSAVSSVPSSAELVPPPNPYAPKSFWPEGHGIYCQQNTEAPGPVATDKLVVDLVKFEQPGFTPTGTILSAPFKDGKSVFWGTNGLVIYKGITSKNSLNVVIANKQTLNYNRATGYWVMDKDNVAYFMDTKAREIIALSSAAPDVPESPIILLRKFKVPALFWGRWPNVFLGMKLLYDGNLVFATRQGSIGVLSRDFKKFTYKKLNEQISNSFAVDEKMNFYVTSKSTLYKFHWTGSSIEERWQVPINGSGSTPTLIGSDNGDRLIAITDKSSPMNLVLIWRDEIPSNWRGLANLDKRIAAAEPITFGQQNTEDIVPTENSLLAFGYGLAVSKWSGFFPALKMMKPGVEKFEWLPKEQKLVVRWVNKNIYIPNSMMGLSQSSNLIYAVGLRRERLRNFWTLEAFSWTTGKSSFYKTLGFGSNRVFNNIGSGIQIGPNRQIITMSPLGVFQVRPEN